MALRQSIVAAIVLASCGGDAFVASPGLPALTADRSAVEPPEAAPDAGAEAAPARPQEAPPEAAPPDAAPAWSDAPAAPVEAGQPDAEAGFVCDPAPCATLGWECGLARQGHGCPTVDCGACENAPPGWTCGSQGHEGRCGNNACTAVLPWSDLCKSATQGSIGARYSADCYLAPALAAADHCVFASGATAGPDGGATADQGGWCCPWGTVLQPDAQPATPDPCKELDWSATWCSVASTTAATTARAYDYACAGGSRSGCEHVGKCDVDCQGKVSDVWCCP